MTDAGYNYSDFADHIRGGAEGSFDGFTNRLHAGERAPSFPLTRLDDGATVEPADLWRRTPTVIEFGSFDEVATRYPELNWVFVYTHEAHPGELVPHHDSMATKLAHARLLRDEVGIRRPILVDDLDGTTHRAYGGLPNMTWVVERGGTIAYKASWTVADNVESFVSRYVQARHHRPPGRRIGPYYTEQLELRDIRRDEFLVRLERNGRRAVEQWDRAEQIMREERVPGG